LITPENGMMKWARCGIERVIVRLGTPDFFNVDYAIKKFTNGGFPFEVVGPLAPSHFTPDPNPAWKQLPKNLPRLRGIGLRE
jgi:hypothetical protein